MKSNKIHITTRTINTALIASCVFIFSSCLKDKAPGSENYSHSPALVSFQYSGFSAKPFIAAVLGTPQDSLSIQVTLSVASLTLGSDVSATISQDDATLAAYNADTTTATYPTTFLPLPAAQYTIENGGKVTIKAGQTSVKFSLHFAGDQIDFTQPYIVALKITSAQGATIATNLNTAVVILKLRNIYEGNYKQSGNRTLYNGPDPSTGVAAVVPLSGTVLLATNTTTSLIAPAADLGTTILLEIDAATNKVTITDPANNFSPLGNDPAEPSTYDPATHTFDLHWFYKNGSGNYRHIDQKFVLQ